jgi:hypothetical protein
MTRYINQELIERSRQKPRLLAIFQIHTLGS